MYYEAECVELYIEAECKVIILTVLRCTAIPLKTDNISPTCIQAAQSLFI